MLRKIKNLCILSITLASFHAAPLMAEPISQANMINKQQMSEELKKGKFTAKVYCDEDHKKPTVILLGYDLLLDSTDRRLYVPSLDFSAEKTDLGVALKSNGIATMIQDPFQRMISEDISYSLTYDSSCGNTPEVNGIDDPFAMTEAIQILNNSKADLRKNNEILRIRSVAYYNFGYGMLTPGDIICYNPNHIKRFILPEKCIEKDELGEQRTNDGIRKQKNANLSSFPQKKVSESKESDGWIEKIFTKTNLYLGISCLGVIAGLGFLYYMLRKRNKSNEKNEIKTKQYKKKVNEMKEPEGQAIVDSKGETMEDEKEFKKQVDSYRATIKEFTAKMRKVKTRTECYEILGHMNNLLKPLLGKNQKLLDALREENEEFDFVLQYKTEEFGEPKKRS